MNRAETRLLEDYRTAAHTVARSIRCLVQDRMRPVLYHGTRYPHQILKGNELRWPDAGLPTISFSRLPEASAYWAIMVRDDDEGQGAVFILDRDRLAQRYKLECQSDEYDDCFPEAEEIVWGRDIVDLHKYVLETLWIDEDLLVGRTTAQLRTITNLRARAHLCSRRPHRKRSLTPPPRFNAANPQLGPGILGRISRRR
jgi:hypothetical protein